MTVKLAVPLDKDKVLVYAFLNKISFGVGIVISPQRMHAILKIFYAV